MESEVYHRSIRVVLGFQGTSQFYLKKSSCFKLLLRPAYVGLIKFVQNGSKLFNNFVIVPKRFEHCRDKPRNLSSCGFAESTVVDAGESPVYRTMRCLGC